MCMLIICKLSTYGKAVVSLSESALALRAGLCGASGAITAVTFVPEHVVLSYRPESSHLVSIVSVNSG